MSDSSEFTCSHCKQTFRIAENAPTKEGLLAEAVANFGVFEDPVVVCDQCYAAFMAWYERQGR